MDAIPYADGCEECARLHLAEKTARDECDQSAEVDARVMARRHLRAEHGVKVQVC